MAVKYGNGNDNTINSTNNDDFIYGKGGKDHLYGLSGDDLLDGGVGDDFLFGGDGNDILAGGKGSDIMMGGLGADQFKGGKGIDTVDYSDATSGVTVWIPTNVSGGYASGDTYTQVENIIGGAYADSLWTSEAGTAFGGAGNDSLYGYDGAGTDGGLLRGDAGQDYLYMGYDNTTAWLQNGQGYDTVDQFVENADNFFIDLSEFGLGNTLDDNEVVNNDTHTAVGGNAQFIYDGNDSKLYFDSNGNAAGGQILIADLTNSSVLSDTLDKGDFEYQV